MICCQIEFLRLTDVCTRSRGCIGSCRIRAWHGAASLKEWLTVNDGKRELCYTCSKLSPSLWLWVRYVYLKFDMHRTFGPCLRWQIVRPAAWCWEGQDTDTLSPGLPSERLTTKECKGSTLASINFKVRGWKDSVSCINVTPLGTHDTIQFQFERHAWQNVLVHTSQALAGKA